SAAPPTGQPAPVVSTSSPPSSRAVAPRPATTCAQRSVRARPVRPAASCGLPALSSANSSTSLTVMVGALTLLKSDTYTLYEKWLMLRWFVARSPPWLVAHWELTGRDASNTMPEDPAQYLNTVRKGARMARIPHVI